MRIAFHGKGGVGKTTTTAGFVEYAAKLYPFVLAVDADLNSHLKDSLGFVGDRIELAKSFDEIMSYLKGARVDIGDRPMIATIPPSMKSRFVRPTADDALVRNYSLMSGNVGLLTVGGYERNDVGSTCFHEKLKSLMAVFHHMLDDDGHMVVVDTIAGTDNISTSLSFAFDLNVFVVEPTAKSIQVYRDYAELVPQYADRLYVIGNKVADHGDVEFIKEHVPAECYLGAIALSSSLKRFEQGDSAGIAKFRSEQAEVFGKISEVLRGKKRDWTQYLSLLRQTYKWDCDRWYSGFYKSDLAEGIDDGFCYEAAAALKTETAVAGTGV